MYSFTYLCTYPTNENNDRQKSTALTEKRSLGRERKKNRFH
jgi:hypothetical protein